MNQKELFFVFDAQTDELVAVCDDYDVAVTYSENDPYYEILYLVCNSFKVCLSGIETIFNLS